MRRYGLRDDQWDRIKDLLPGRAGSVGVTAADNRLFVEAEGHDRVYAIADEDMDRENAEKTSAVHFVRFELTPGMCASVKAGAGVKLGCDHTHYPAHTQISPETLAALVADLR